MNISVTTDNMSHETIEITTVLQHFGSTGGQSYSTLTMVATTTAASFLAIAANAPLIYILLKQTSKTFLDWLILADCFLGIINGVFAIIIVAALLTSSHLCFTLVIPFYLVICNRLLTLSIVICRYVFVLQSTLVSTKGQRKAFECFILTFTFITPLLMSMASIYYGGNAYISKYGNLLSICKKLVKILLYLCLKLFARCIIILIHLQKFCSECRGRSHEFYYNLEDFYEDFSDGKALALGILSLPLLHPFWLAILLCVCSNFVIVPICYGRIYRCD